MVRWFYSLPLWATIVVVLAIALAAGLASSFGLRRLFRLESTGEDREHAVSLMQVVAAYIGILIAFAGVQVWQDFSDAQEAVNREAAAASQLYRGLAAYGPETASARSALRGYVQSILVDEWPQLSNGKPSPRTDVALFTLYEEMGTIRPKDERDAAIYGTAFDSLKDLVGLRRDRLIHSNSGMPTILWIVGLFGSILIVAYTATFRRSRTNTLMISGISLALGLVFLFILVVDRPFLGSVQVSNGELAGLGPRFDLLDRLSAARLQAERRAVLTPAIRPAAR